MTREEAKIFLLQLHTDKQLNKSEHEALRIAVKALEQEPCREADDYENEISDLYNRLDIAEYDKERLREEVTTLEEKLKGLSAEPCGDAISRQAVLDAMCTLCNTGETLKENPWRDNPHIDAIIDALDNLPSVNPQKSKTGRWIAEENEEMETVGYYCSECDLPMETEQRTNFCPNCGAKMLPTDSEKE